MADGWRLSEFRFTPRQDEIIGLIAQGYRTAEIAQELGITRGTVTTHIAHAMHRSQCRTRSELAVFWAVAGRFRGVSI